MIHQKIAELMVAQATINQSPLKTLLDGKDTTQICHGIFVNFRGDPSCGKGLRLSDIGLQLMKAFFKCYDLTLCPGYRVKAQHLIYMDRVSTMPYWISNQYCAIFDSDLAMMLRLADGNIQNLIDSRFRLISNENNLNADM